MSTFRRPTLDEIYGSGEVATEQAIAARKRRPTLEQLFPRQPKKEVPFEDGSTLQATVPLPGNWPTVDTGIPIGTGTAQLLAGAGKRFSDLRLRAEQLGGVPGATQEARERLERDRPLMETPMGMAGSMLPDIVAASLVPGSYKAGALLGGAQGLSQPTTTDDGLGETALNVGMGTLGGTLGTYAGKKLSNALGKIPHAAPAVIPEGVRRAAANRGINLPEPKWSNPEQQALARAAQAEGVPLSIGDIDPASGWVRAERILENLPANRRQFMASQREANTDMVNRLRDSFGASSKGKEGADIAQGLREQYQANKQMASHLFDNVKIIAKQPGTTPVEPINTFQAAQNAAKEYPDLFDEFKNSGFMRKLLGLERDMGPQPGLIIDPSTNQPFKYDQKLSFEEAQFARKRLGEWYSKLRTQADKGTLPQGLDRSAVAQAAKIFSAFDNDLDAWGQQPGNDALNEAWRGARKYYADNVVPYTQPVELSSRSPVIRDIVEDRIDPATVVDKVLPTRETSIAQDVMSLASPRGQQAAKAALIDKMTEEAASPDLAGLNNAALLRHTNKYGASGESVFSPTEQARIKQVRDVAKATQRSQTDPSQAASLWSNLVGGSAVGTMPFAAMHAMTALSPEATAADKAWAGFFMLPAMAAIAGRGAQGYSASRLGQNIHFADPALQGAGGALQRMLRAGMTGSGQPLQEAFRQGRLGHSEDENE